MALVLTGDDVHIWTVRHDDSTLHDEDSRELGVLSDAEIARFNGFAKPGQRARRIHARAALRRILASCLETSPGRIVIHTGPHGKPSVSGVEFNCSHSPSLTLVAVAAQPVGVDIEPVGASDGIETIRHRFVNASDHGGTGVAERSSGSIDLLRLWVIKEASLKALGTGLSVDPRELSALSPAQDVFEVHRGADALCARLLAIPGGHVAAVAARTLPRVVMHGEAHTWS